MNHSLILLCLVKRWANAITVGMQLIRSDSHRSLFVQRVRCIYSVHSSLTVKTQTYVCVGGIRRYAWAVRIKMFGL